MSLNKLHLLFISATPLFPYAYMYFLQIFSRNYDVDNLQQGELPKHSKLIRHIISSNCTVCTIFVKRTYPKQYPQFKSFVSALGGRPLLWAGVNISFRFVYLDFIDWTKVYRWIRSDLMRHRYRASDNQLTEDCFNSIPIFVSLIAVFQELHCPKKRSHPLHRGKSPFTCLTQWARPST